MDLRGLAQSILQAPGKVGKWGSENYIYDPKTKTPFPAGLIGKSIQTDRLPKGSTERKQAMFDTAMMPVMGLSGGVQSSRPIHQVLLEKAANSGDMKGVGQILDAIPATDPYKASMERLFRPHVPQVKGASTSIHPDDMDVMEKVIDYARLKKPFDYKTEMMAGDLLDRYPLKTKGNQPKNMTEVANIFDKALQTLINKK